MRGGLERQSSCAAVANTWLSAPLVIYCPACWRAAPDLALAVCGFESDDVEAVVAVMHGAAASLRLINDLTVHGLRATFKTWASDRTSFQNEIVEAALAHIVGDKVEQAYRRSDLFEK